jgi:D-alanine--poly(phosphoribitol) ligase subunit 1
LNFNPALAFFENALARPDSTAIAEGTRRLTYGDAAGRACAIAVALAPVVRPGARVAILGSRSLEACLAVLGVLWTGAAYVPLGLKLPEDRLIHILRSVGFDALICDRAGEALMSPALRAAAPSLVLLAAPDGPELGLYRPGAAGAPLSPPAGMAAADLAYVEFTSGTTGLPKGVEIVAGGLRRYVETMQDWFPLTADDRVAETSDLSFDISVNNMFSAWGSGAALHILPASGALGAVKFIQDQEITYWYSTPSSAAMLQQVRTLRPGALPSLRRSVFAGEPLAVALAEAWLDAAPNSTLDNLYGPTEATVVCLRQEVARPPRVTPERGFVAIGKPFPEMRVAILDADLRPLPPGERGEIALSGPQLARGYLNQNELTLARFPVVDGVRWYLTGDLGYLDDDGAAHMLGRIDNQVKVLGNRVELEEVELHLRRTAGTASAAAVAWPIGHGVASGLIGFVSQSAAPAHEIIAAMRKALPAYMAPHAIVEMDALPLNANGKIDRKALVSLLARDAA